MSESVQVKVLSENGALKDGKRNLGLDLLRIFSMIGIIAWHLFVHGDILNLVPNGTTYHYIFLLIKSLAFFSVNIFVLISGYFLSKQQFRLKKMIRLIVEVSFWGIVCYLASIIVGGGTFSLFELVKSLFSWFFGIYWFPTVYLVLYALSPFINMLLEKLNKEKYLVLVALFLFISSAPFLSSELGINENSIIWFVSLYLVGAYVREYNFKGNKLIDCILLAFCVAVIFAIKVVDHSLMSKVEMYAWRYNSVFCLLGSFALFDLFREVKFNNVRIGKLLGAIAGLTFGVYLIHDNAYFRSTLWSWVHTVFAFADSTGLLVKAILAVLFVFVFALVLEALRKQMFKWLQIDKFCNALSNFIIKIKNKIFRQK